MVGAFRPPLSRYLPRGMLPLARGGGNGMGWVVLRRKGTIVQLARDLPFLPWAYAMGV